MKKFGPEIGNEGGRNLFCSQYRDCLDYVIKRRWDSWNCTRCDFKNRVDENEIFTPMYSEEVPYYEFIKDSDILKKDEFGKF